MMQNTVRNFASIGAVIILALGAGFGQAQAGVVTSSLDDSSLGSLRQIIANAAVGETITFDPSLIGKTIVLASGQLVLTKNVQIAGPGADQLKISGSGVSRVFYVNSGVTATISGLTIANGNGMDPVPSTGGTAGGVVLANSGTNILSGTTTVTGGTLVLNPGTVIPTGSATTTVNTVLTTSAGGLVNVGSGSLIPTGANSSIGSAVVTGGTLTANSGALTPTGTPTTVNASLATTGGGLVKTGAGTLVLAGTNTYTGSTAITGGTLVLNAGAVLPTGTSAVTAANGTVLTGSPTPVLTNGGTLVLNGGTSPTTGGTLATTGNVGGTSLGSTSGGTLVLGGGTLTPGPGSLDTTGGLGGGPGGGLGGGIIVIRSTGGGIYNDGGILTVSDCTIADNTMGAGIFTHGNFNISATPAISGGLKLINCTVSGNSGPVGGIQNGGLGTTTVVNGTIAGNRGDFAGASYNDFGAQLTLSNSTVSGNIGGSFPPSLEAAGGVRMAGGSLVVNGITRLNSILASNTIFSNNIGGNFYSAQGGGVATTSSGYNLSDDTTMAGFLTGPGDLNSTPAGLDMDAQAQPRLQDNGGPTKTIALLPGSAAIDKGMNPFNPNPALPSDQRGFPRVANGRLDIGAFETQTPRSLTIAVQRALQAIPATTDPTGRALRAALDSLTLSLYPAFWVDDTHLTMWGRWVFNADRFAVEVLTRVVKAGGPRAADAQDWIDYIAEADEVLAKVAIRDAAAGDPGKLAEANRELAAAEQSLAQNNSRDAIEHFAKAWEQAQKAMRKIPRVPVGT